MQRDQPILLNKYFHSLFLVWVVVGGILLYLFDKKELFAAVNTHYHPSTDLLMVFVTYMGQPELIVPTLLILMLLPPFRSWQFFVVGVVSNIPPLFIQQSLKRMFHEPRPLFYFHFSEQQAPWLHYNPAWPELLRNSFPSGHSQGAFSFFCFLTLLLPAKQQKLGILFFFMALAVCYSRLYLAAHFFADVYTGSIIGCVSTTLLFTVAQNLINKYGKKKTPGVTP